MSDRSSRRRGLRIAVLLTIFICGGIVGAAIGSQLTRQHLLTVLRTPEQLPDRLLARIRAEMALDEEQAQRILAIIRRRHQTMEAYRAESYPRQMAEFKAMQQEVNGFLSADQSREWLSLCESVQQRYLPPQPNGPPPAELLFDRFDVNRDEVLEADEVPPQVWRRLQLADQNRDGKVTLEEYLRTLKQKGD